MKLSENKSEGIVWLPIKNFKNGTVKIEMRGKNVFQKSFIGIAFHGQDDKTYDAVYCRPFNFIAKDSIRRVHAIQYVSHPIYTWKKLREEKNSLYEKEIIKPPNPDDWFTMTIVVDNKSVKAYINDAKKPALEVDKLNNNRNGKIGLFMGDDSGGDFGNMTLKYLK
nr:family 16 glycoside hydrolase [uncultured Flavobacterium sp.]